MKTIVMHGPDLDDPSKTVELEVPEADVHAYLKAGYEKGGLPEVEEVVSDATEEVPTTPAPKSRKKKATK